MGSIWYRAIAVVVLVFILVDIGQCLAEPAWMGTALEKCPECAREKGAGNLANFMKCVCLCWRGEDMITVDEELERYCRMFKLPVYGRCSQYEYVEAKMWDGNARKCFD